MTSPAGARAALDRGVSNVGGYHRAVRRAASVLLLAAVVGAAALGGQARASAAAPRVTLFGDSVASVIGSVPQAREYLGRGLDLNLELRVCRRLVAVSCPYQGVRPPTVLDVVEADDKQTLGNIVVVDVGYNDYVSTYRDDMDRVVQALVDKGVEHIVWTTLHEVRDDYRIINRTIVAEAGKWPQVVVADWQRASTGQSWFGSDGIHLNAGGAMGLARLLRPLILSFCQDPCQPPPAGSARPLFVLRLSRRRAAVGRFTIWAAARRGTYESATLAFGPASSCRLASGRKSRVTWSSLGLTMQFIAAPGAVCASPATVYLQTLTATGRRWRTSAGLAVGSPLATLERLYPDSPGSAGRFRLVGIDRPGTHVVLFATVADGRVVSLGLVFRASP